LNKQEAASGIAEEIAMLETLKADAVIAARETNAGDADDYVIRFMDCRAASIVKKLRFYVRSLLRTES
jgi:hypothetical protein